MTYMLMENDYPTKMRKSSRNMSLCQEVPAPSLTSTRSLSLLTTYSGSAVLSTLDTKTDLIDEIEMAKKIMCERERELIRMFEGEGCK